MEDSIQKMLAGLKKPGRKWKQLSVRVSDKEFLELQSFCQVRFLNYTEVVRAAIQQFITKDNT